MATLQPYRHRQLEESPVSRRTAGDLPVYLAAVLGYLLLLPPQFNLNIANSVVPPYRFFLLAVSLYMFASMLRGRTRLAWPDVIIAATIGWICLAMSQTSHWQQALTADIAHFSDVGLAYFFGRLAFRDLRDLRMFLVLLLPGLLLVGGIMVIESVTHTHIIQELASRVTGEPLDYRSDARMGLMRAQGPFPHPILAGLFLSSFLPLYWLAGFRGWVKLAGAAAAACSFFSISSATLLSLFAGTAMLAYNWLTEVIANVTWKLFFVFAALFVFAAELGTKSGTFSLLVRFASLNSGSAYNRILIWDYGSRNVAQHPWFGIGYAAWDAPSWMGFSIDNYWLLLAIRFGIPVPVFIGIATIISMVMIVRKSATSTIEDQRCERGLAITLGVMALGMISVSLWLSPQIWYFMALGLTVSMALARRGDATVWPSNVQLEPPPGGR